MAANREAASPYIEQAKAWYSTIQLLEGRGAGLRAQQIGKLRRATGDRDRLPVEALVRLPVENAASAQPQAGRAGKAAAVERSGSKRTRRALAQGT